MRLFGYHHTDISNHYIYLRLKATTGYSLPYQAYFTTVFAFPARYANTHSLSHVEGLLLRRTEQGGGTAPVSVCRFINLGYKRISLRVLAEVSTFPRGFRRTDPFERHPHHAPDAGAKEV
jgi:hypothetical protein